MVVWLSGVRRLFWIARFLARGGLSLVQKVVAASIFLKLSGRMWVTSAIYPIGSQCIPIKQYRQLLLIICVLHFIGRRSCGSNKIFASRSLSAFFLCIGSVSTNAACCDAVLEARVALLLRVIGPRAFVATHTEAATGRAAREVQLDKL
jgi:hypothetical protein